MEPRITLVPPTAVVRTAERHPLSVGVDILNEETFFPGMTGNISEGGVFVAAEQRPLGTILHVRFRLPGDSAPMMMVTEVRWLSDEGMGLRFVRAKLRDLERIRAFVSVHGVSRQPVGAFL